MSDEYAPDDDGILIEMSHGSEEILDIEVKMKKR